MLATSLHHHHRNLRLRPRYAHRHGAAAATSSSAGTAPKLAAQSRKLTADDPALLSTWRHRAWVAAGSTSLLVSLAKCVSGCAATGQLVGPALAAVFGFFLADLGSGIYHWGIDNYGDASTPVFGEQIEAFQGHHRRPWTITWRETANNLHPLARAVMAAVVPFDVGVDDPTVHAFVAVCGGCVMLSQQFHAWAHGRRSRLPPVVAALQDAGVLVSRRMHGAHHRPPYNGNYCIVSGAWNGFLDRNRVLEAAEMVLFFRFGVRPRSWAPPEEQWREEGEVEEAL